MDSEFSARLGKLVVSGAALITLTRNENLLVDGDCDVAVPSDRASLRRSALKTCVKQPFLRIPPFPGAKLHEFAASGPSGVTTGDLRELIVRLRVGGTFWAAQPRLPQQYVLVRTAGAVELARAIAADLPIVLWTPRQTEATDVVAITGNCDPWHMLSGAVALVTEADDETRVVAALLGVPAYVHDDGDAEVQSDDASVAALLDDALPSTFENPFNGEMMSAVEAVELCGFWRRLIDSNRRIGAGLGFAFWKQSHVAPLLWDGSGDFQFVRSASDFAVDRSVAVWRAKADDRAVAEFEQAGVDLIEVEDGFLRSRGLGADCIPPLSITVDSRAPHFDPSRPSELEFMIEHGEFDDQLLSRACELRRAIVDAGLGKYEQGREPIDRLGGDRRHILVPGQVEDDRAVQVGGCGLTSNLELLERVRAQAPDAFILYKPHPDVLAGHRRGAVADRDCLEVADRIVGDLSIASLIDLADEVHVNTSLAGFEALMRGKGVTTYGVPFYAGWGLTRDLGPVPQRRTARRTIDELVAATLLVYPRYLDPVTGLPCPAEVVVARLSDGARHDPSLLVGMRRLQGRLMRRLRSLVQ